jgi:hypothetical protein
MFLGAASGTYPNIFAVSNIVRYMGGLQESRGTEIVQGSLSAYDNRFTYDRRRAEDLVRRAVKGRPIFWPQPSHVSMLRYPEGTGYFTPIF